jgi:hypothetical protein
MFARTRAAFLAVASEEAVDKKGWKKETMQKSLLDAAEEDAEPLLDMQEEQELTAARRGGGIPFEGVYPLAGEIEKSHAVEENRHRRGLVRSR